MRQECQHCEREDGGADGGEEVHRVVVEPSAPLQGGSQQAVEEEAEEAACSGNPKHLSAAAEGQGSGGRDNACCNHAGQRTGQTDGSVRAWLDHAQGRHHAWAAAQHLANLG